MPQQVLFVMRVKGKGRESVGGGGSDDGGAGQGASSKFPGGDCEVIILGAAGAVEARYIRIELRRWKKIKGPRQGERVALVR